MSTSDFKDMFTKLLDIDSKLRLFRRKQKLRNRLKILGVGFLIYRNVQIEIEESLSRRKILLANIEGSLSAYINALRNEIENIRTSNVYISKDNESNWLNRIGESKKELTYLQSIGFLDRSQAERLIYLYLSF